MGYLIPCIFAFAALASFVGEVASWWLSFRDEKYCELVKDVKSCAVSLEELKKTVTGGASKTAEKRSGLKLKYMKEELQAKSQALTWQTMKAQLVPSVALMALMPFAFKYLRNIVACQLPFHTFSLLRRLTQQGLDKDQMWDERDLSAVSLYFLALSFTRIFVKKLFPQPPNVQQYITAALSE